MMNGSHNDTRDMQPTTTAQHTGRAQPTRWYLLAALLLFLVLLHRLHVMLLPVLQVLRLPLLVLLRLACRPRPPPAPPPRTGSRATGCPVACPGRHRRVGGLAVCEIRQCDISGDSVMHVCLVSRSFFSRSCVDSAPPPKKKQRSHRRVSHHQPPQPTAHDESTEEIPVRQPRWRRAGRRCCTGRCPWS